MAWGQHTPIYSLPFRMIVLEPSKLVKGQREEGAKEAGIAGFFRQVKGSVYKSIGGGAKLLMAGRGLGSIKGS